MADVQRTRAAILALFADNVTGQISEQDLRDFVVTVMESEFAYAGDFWNQPKGEFTTTDKWARGSFAYSQILSGNCSFGNVLALTSTGLWQLANCANSRLNGPMLGLAMDSYTSNASQCQILLKGMLYDSSFSALFAGNYGRPIYLDSGVPGSITIAGTSVPIAASCGSKLSNFCYVLGYIALHSTPNSVSGGKWFFDPRRPHWGVTGV